jgi:DNA polymerase-3 subunit beta
VVIPKDASSFAYDGKKAMLLEGDTGDIFHISVERKEMLHVLTRQQSLVERRPSLAILSHILLEAKEGRLSIKGTDMEMSLLETLPACVHKEGAVAVPAHMLYDIIKNFPETQDIHFQSLSAHRLLVSGAAIEFKIPTLDAKDFPHVSNDQGFSFHMKIDASLFKKMIDDTRFSMSNEEARYSLNGIYFHAKGHLWCAVSTDAQRLALSTAEMDPAVIAQAPGVIIGRKAVHEIAKILDDAKGDVSLSLSESSMLLAFHSGTFTSRLLEGQFPDYWQAIPKNHPKEICIDIKPFQEAVRRVGMVSADKHGSVKMAFEKGMLTLSAQSQQGSAVEVLNVDYDGDPVFIGLNPKYLYDVCQHIEGEKIKIFFKDTQSPVLLHDSKTENATFVIMPMRIVE